MGVDRPAPVALTLALASAGALAVPGPGKLVAIGLGIFAAAMGLRAFRRRDARPAARLLGGASAALGIVALVLGGAKVAVTLLALQHVARLAP